MNKLTVDELSQLCAKTIVQVVTDLGLMPTSASVKSSASVAHAKFQLPATNTPAKVSVAGTDPFKGERIRLIKEAGLDGKSGYIPKHGDYHSFVGVQESGPNAGNRVKRVKLPIPLFSEFDQIVLVLNDVPTAFKADSEGRHRLNREQLDSLNAMPGDYIVYTELSPGTFEVTVDSSQRAKALHGGSVHSTVTVPKVNKVTVIPRVKEMSVEDAFAPEPIAPEVGKKQRSAAQLANDENLRRIALARKAEREQSARSNKPLYVRVEPSALTLAQRKAEQRRAGSHVGTQARNAVSIRRIKG
jgi:hypothetical protein